MQLKTGVMAILANCAIGLGYLACWAFWGGRPDSSAELSHCAFALIVGQVLFVPALVLSQQVTQKFRCAAILGLIPLAALSALAAWALPWQIQVDFSAPMAMRFGLQLASFGILLVGLFHLEARILGPSSRGLATMILAFVFVCGPLLLNEYLAQNNAQSQSVAVIEQSLLTSPLALGSRELLEYDVFKNAAFYHRFRIGEQIAPFPSMAAANRSMLTKAAVIWAILAMLALIQNQSKARRLASQMP